MKIMIDSTDVKTKNGTSKSGAPYSIREQEAYLDTGKRFPEAIKLNLERDQQPHPVGEYSIDIDRSVYVGRFGGLELSSSPVLVLFSTSVPAASAARGSLFRNQPNAASLPATWPSWRRPAVSGGVAVGVRQRGPPAAPPRHASAGDCLPGLLSMGP